MSLTDKHIYDLGWICEESGFILDTIFLIDYFEGMGKKPFVPRRKETEKIKKFLSGISKESRSDIKLFHAERMYLKKRENESWESLKEGSDYCPIPFEMNSEHDLVNQMLLAIEKQLEHHPLKSPSKRILIGNRALEILNRYGIHAGTSNTGPFAKYIKIILDALGLDHGRYGPQNIVKEVLKKV